MSGFSILALTGGVIFLALRDKSISSAHLIYVNVAVSNASKIFNNVTNLFTNLKNMVTQMTSIQKVPFEILNTRTQKDFDTPSKPNNWPLNGKIQLKNVKIN